MLSAVAGHYLKSIDANLLRENYNVFMGRFARNEATRLENPFSALTPDRATLPLFPRALDYLIDQMK